METDVCSRLTVVPLTPERLDDFLAFFETALPEEEWGYRCYCAAFCGKDNCSEEGMEKPEVRREAAIRYIREGTLCGYLAYEGDTVVGWCSANDRNASRKCFGVRWILGGELSETEEKAMSVFCFEVAPAFRGRHVATALLEHLIEDARASGCKFVEGYPLRESPEAVTENYSGHIALYEKHGFRPIGETPNGHTVMRKMLLDKADAGREIDRATKSRGKADRYDD